MKRWITVIAISPFAALLFGATNAPAASPDLDGNAAPRAAANVAARAGVAAPVRDPARSATSGLHPLQGGACPAGMVEVEGDYCPVVKQVCVKWEGKNGEKRDRCAEYRPDDHCLGKPVHKRFCIDKYEYPNKEGVKPAVAVTWEEARDQCAAEGKRLCGSQEWTLACEGAEHLPYPTGYTRDANACNYDRPYIMPNDAAFKNPETRADEIARIDQRDPSGTRNSCVSPYGVADMAGNVDEWVLNEGGHADKAPYQSGLKGGYWGPVRNRCRPMTTDHNRWHIGYQIGFRCCSDAP
jgi:formylglycine-generating enzyme required for sulfatase activity